MNRRGFLGSILAACAAPAIVRADSLMRIVPRDLTVAGLPYAELYQRTFDELAELAEGTWTPTIEGWDSQGKQIAMPGTWVRMGNTLVVTAAIDVRTIRARVAGDCRIVLER